MKATEIIDRLWSLGDPARARVSQRFFKTGPGEYGAGDVFAGLTVPQTRALAKELRELPRAEALKLLHAPLHEARLLALLILMEAYAKGGERERESIFNLYLRNTRRINNWDLVDVSAPAIVGEHLLGRDRSVLDRLVRSGSLWERRIAMLATLAFIRRGELADTLRLAEALLGDDEDLMHKAAGWMLREVGKRSLAAEETFLDAHAAAMPRTMLRYAVERFPLERRRHYLLARRRV